MKKLIIFIFFILVITMCVGFYLKYYSDETLMGDRFIGITILAAILVLMPLFLYHRWKNRKVKDYMLTEDNINKMREFSERKKRDKL
jgi:membrane protein YdbS with pleckstrin-like domain